MCLMPVAKYGQVTLHVDKEVFRTNHIELSAKSQHGHYFVGKFTQNVFFEALLTYPDATVCQGCFYNDHQGNGTIKYPDGKVYHGEWKEGHPHGVGTLTTKEHTYTGCWAFGLFHGFGKITYANGDTFDGHYKNDFKCGYGILKCVNGDSYSGEWLNGCKHGKGTMRYASGYEVKGLWVNDKLLKVFHIDKTKMQWFLDEKNEMVCWLDPTTKTVFDEHGNVLHYPHNQHVWDS